MLISFYYCVCVYACMYVCVHVQKLEDSLCYYSSRVVHLSFQNDHLWPKA